MDTAKGAGHPLGWKQTRPTERHSPLLATDSEATLLAFPGAPGLPPAGELGGGGPTPSRVDPHSTSITLRAAGTGTDLAVYTPNAWSAGGTLAFPNGRTIRVTTRMR